MMRLISPRIFPLALLVCLAVFVPAGSASAAGLLKFHFNNNSANIDETTPWTGTTTFAGGLRAFGSGSIGLKNGGLAPLGNANIWGGYATMTASSRKSNTACASPPMCPAVSCASG